MKLLEYEAKYILREHNVPVPDSLTITKRSTPELTLPVVLKSQVPTGGRGKAGGIILVKEQKEITPAINRIFSLDIQGYKPEAILAEQAIDIASEYYLSLLIDRNSSSIQLMAHINGGVEVEENDKDSFFTSIITSDTTKDIGDKLAEYYKLPDQAATLQVLVSRLYECFVKSDATLLEINPLILTTDGDIVAGDCKMELDDAASFRHPDWNFQNTPQDTNFVTLDKDGEVATIANGAGLAMATVDAVAAAGMKPANFLDIGGGANTESILVAFQQIMEFPNIQAIIINIFAGITRCDEVAKAIIAARQHIDNLPPLYIRLAGTNFEEAVSLLSNENIATLATLEECLAAVKEAQS